MQRITETLKNERRLRWVENSAGLSAIYKYSVGNIPAGGSFTAVSRSVIGWKARQGLLIGYYLKKSGTASVSVLVNGEELLLNHAAGDASGVLCPAIKKGVNTLTVVVHADGGTISSGEIFIKIVDLG